MSNEKYPPTNLPTSAQIPMPHQVHEPELRRYAENLYNALNAYTSDVARVVHVLSQHRTIADTTAEQPDPSGSGVFFLDITTNKLYFDNPLSDPAAWSEFAFNADTINDEPVNAPAPSTGEILVYDGDEYIPSSGGGFLDANAISIQGVGVDSAAPTDGQAFIFDLSNDEWAPTFAAPLLNTNAITIQGEDVNSASPSTGDIFVYDTDEWVPSGSTSEYGILDGLITDQIWLDKTNRDVRLTRTAANYIEFKTATSGVWASSIFGNLVAQRSNTANYPQFQLRAYHDDASPAYNLFYKARGTYASPSDVLNNDNLGQLTWYGRMNSAFVNQAYLLAKVAGAPAAGKAPSLISFGCHEGTLSSPKEMFRIDGSAMPTIYSFEQFRLADDGIAWDDVKVDINALKVTGANQPAWEQVTDDGSGSSGVYAWNFDVGDEAWFEMQLPHRYKEGTNIDIHYHWCAEGYTATAKNVKFGLEYIWRNITGFMGNNTTVQEAQDTIAAGTSKIHQLTDLSATGQAGSGQNVSSVILGRIYRTAADSDEYSGGVFILSVDAHVQVDALGSDEEYSKT